MTDKFPVLAQSTIEALSEFLVRPSPILVKLNTHAGGLASGHNDKKPGFSVTVTDDTITAPVTTFPTANGVGCHGGMVLRGEKSKMKACAIFEQLRDAAIENVCR